MLCIRASEVGQRADDVVVTDNVIHGITIFYLIVLIHPVGVLQHHCFQADIISMRYAQPNTWKSDTEVFNKIEVKLCRNNLKQN